MNVQRSWLRSATVGALFLALLVPKNALAQVEESPNGGMIDTEIDSSDAPSTAAFQTAKSDGRVPWFSNAQLIERLQNLPETCVRPQLTGAVKGYINTYALRKRDKTERILGRRLQYFPMFERYLKQNGMPSELKYLAVVESALDPKAESKAGAMGLWQFMSYTGAEYGLEITRWCDERQDPNKATDAAMRYLKRLHGQFGSWELALAAYNSGPTRVANAIKRAHSRNFWRLQKYLPQETANYVPAFIAAMYICHYFQDHNLQPELPPFDMQLTESVRVHETTTFSDIAGATGIDYFIIRDLNPAYRQNFIPQSSEGHFVTVPKRAFPALLRWLSERAGKEYYAERPVVFAQVPANSPSAREQYVSTSYQPSSGETIESISNMFGIDPEHIRLWNQMPWGIYSPCPALKILQPVSILPYSPPKAETAPSPKPSVSDKKKTALAEPRERPSGNKKNEKAAEPVAKPTAAQPATEAAPAAASPGWHTVQRGESLPDIARKYGLTPEELKIFNPKGNFSVGARVRLKPE